MDKYDPFLSCTDLDDWMDYNAYWNHITLWALLKKIKFESFRYYLLIAIIWTLVAVVFDYFFLVITFNPADGYYKLDIYLYYILTFIMPLIVGWNKIKNETT